MDKLSVTYVPFDSVDNPEKEAAMKHPAMKLLGHRARDKVLGIEGVVTSICFDLYGCIQADLKLEGLTDKEEIKPGYWFDIKRLEVLSDKPVMEVPDFSMSEIGASDKSPR